MRLVDIWTPVQGLAHQNSGHTQAHLVSLLTSKYTHPFLVCLFIYWLYRAVSRQLYQRPWQPQQNTLKASRVKDGGPGHCSGPEPSSQIPSGRKMKMAESLLSVRWSRWPCRTNSHLLKLCGSSFVKYSETEADEPPNSNPRDGTEYKCGTHADVDLNLDDGWGH